MARSLAKQDKINMYQLLADAAIFMHFLFIIFAVCGGLLLFATRKAAWVHLPALFWAAYIEFSGANCPLTDIENYFRLKAGEQGYHAGFIEHYITAIVYPSGLTREIQLLLGGGLIFGNVLVYCLAFRKPRPYHSDHARGKTT